MTTEADVRRAIDASGLSEARKTELHREYSERLNDNNTFAVKAGFLVVMAFLVIPVALFALIGALT